MQKDIKTEIAEYLAKHSEWDTSESPMVSTTEARSLGTKGVSGYGKAPWNEEELSEKIYQCIVLLDYYGHKINPSNIEKLLGLKKNYEYFTDIGARHFVKELSKEMIENHLNVPTEGQDPQTVEHTTPLICSTEQGSPLIPPINSLNLTSNQHLFGAMLQPIFTTVAMSPIVVNNEPHRIIGNSLTTITLMTLVLQMALGQRKWFHHATSMGKVSIYCKHLNGCIRAIVATNRIHSKNAHLEYLFKQDRQFSFTQLFERYDRYINGIQSYKYRLTPLMLEVLADAINIFIQLELELSRVATRENDIIMTAEMLTDINPRDIFILLNHLSGINEEENYIIRNDVVDRQKSRVYSLMTSVKSDTREKLGYINYDISACMQTIVSHFVDMSRYPKHQDLIDDKRVFRQCMADALNVDIDKVKEILAAADNGSKHVRLSGRSETLRAYIIEADTMVDEFMTYMKEHNPDLILNATSYAKHDMEIVRWEKKKRYTKEQPVFERGELKKYSLFFFVWTQIERKIRHAMMSCFDGFVHEVHDAVYSKQDIPCKTLEQAVLEQTGISVKIEH